MNAIKRCDKSIKSGIILLVLFALLSACDSVNPIIHSTVATVNGEKIYQKELDLRLNLQKGILSPRAFSSSLNKRDALEEEILDSIITEKIMLQRARDLKITVTKEELENKLENIRKDYGDDFFTMLADQNVRYDDWREHIKKEMLIGKLVEEDVNARIQIPEQEIRDFYEDNPRFCKVEGRVHALQIFLRDEAKAHEVKMRLDKGEDFSSLAREVSLGPEKTSGGDLGWITRQTMPDPLDKTLFGLPPGKISPVIKSAYGYHIIKIVEVYRARIKDFASCRQDIIDKLRSQEQERAFTVWLEKLKANAVIKKEPRTAREKTIK